ncbi:hypothetical protein [Agathobaculum sp. Marseille-P7918]|uniref:hypothetical protein n=1 Tax=Agathobaculum sp. Marseille-P7918 TaxID=2479843 RepID=UPI000F634368|nr:hypothetical protein [Agathobaculum sp. Marseille-P7918]
MAHQTEIVVNGVVTEVTEFDHTAQEIDDSVDRAMLSLLAVAAAVAYNPSGTYVIGDYCTNDGNLYKCNTPIESGEAWNAAHWTATTVVSELADVRASLSNKVSYIGPPLDNIAIATQITASLFGFNNTCPDDPYGGSSGVGITIPGWENGVWGTQIVFDYNGRAPFFRTFFSFGQSVGDWIKLATATPPQEYELPLAADITNYATSVYHKNQFNEVSVRVSVSVTNAIQNGATIATLPEGFRPMKAIDTDATGYVSGSSWFACRLVIQPSGAVQVYWGIGSSVATFIVGSFEPYLAIG